jgi:PAS domain S-box-containing protein
MSDKGAGLKAGSMDEVEALVAIEPRLRAFIQVLPDLALILDQDGRYVEILNPGNPLLYKQDAGLRGKLLHEVFPSSLADAYLAVIHKAIETGAPQEFEYSLEVMAGPCWFDALVAPIPVEPGSKPMVVWLARDITERKRAEGALKDSQYYFENLDRISRAISQACDIDDMLFRVVQEILTIFQADRTWFVYPCDPDSPTWSVPVEATVPEYPGLYALKTEMPRSDVISRVFNLALDCPEPFIFVSTRKKEILEDGIIRPAPDCPLSSYESVELDEFAVINDQFGIKSQMAIAMRPKVGKPWLLGMHQCAYHRHWSDNEARLFHEIAERITDCLTNFVLFRQLEEDIAVRRRSEVRAQELLERNRALTQRLFSVQEEERRHLSRELHDEFGQLLTAINLHAQAVGRQCGDQSPGLRESARVVAEGSAQIIRDIRNMVRQLRPHALDELGLAMSLNELVLQIRSQCPELSITLDLQGELNGLGEVLNITLYRLIQEGITNVIKHAKANSMRISLHHRRTEKAGEGVVELLMQDDGVGVELDGEVIGMGLMGMRERVLALGGSFHLGGEERGGVKIKASIPVMRDP